MTEFRRPRAAHKKAAPPPPGRDWDSDDDVPLARHVSPSRHRKCPAAGCDAAFKGQEQLLMHITTDHPGYRFECEVAGCSRSFKTKAALDKHDGELSILTTGKKT